MPYRDFLAECRASVELYATASAELVCRGSTVVLVSMSWVLLLWDELYYCIIVLEVILYTWWIRFEPLLATSSLNDSEARSDQGRRVKLSEGQSVMKLLRIESHKIMFLRLLWEGSIFEPQKMLHNRRTKAEKCKWQKKKTTGVLKSMMQDQKGCKNSNIRAWRGTGNCCTDETRRRGRRYRRMAGGEGKIREQRENTAKRTKQASKTTSVIAIAFALPPLNSTKINKNYESL